MGVYYAIPTVPLHLSGKYYFKVTGVKADGNRGQVLPEVNSAVEEKYNTTAKPEMY